MKSLRNLKLFSPSTRSLRKRLSILLAVVLALTPVSIAFTSDNAAGMLGSSSSQSSSRKKSNRVGQSGSGNTVDAPLPLGLSAANFFMPFLVGMEPDVFENALTVFDLTIADSNTNEIHSGTSGMLELFLALSAATGVDNEDLYVAPDDLKIRVTLPEGAADTLRYTPSDITIVPGSPDGENEFDWDDDNDYLWLLFPEGLSGTDPRTVEFSVILAPDGLTSHDSTFLLEAIPYYQDVEISKTAQNEVRFIADSFQFDHDMPVSFSNEYGEIPPSEVFVLQPKAVSEKPDDPHDPNKTGDYIALTYPNIEQIMQQMNGLNAGNVYARRLVIRDEFEVELLPNGEPALLIPAIYDDNYYPGSEHGIVPGNRWNGAFYDHEGLMPQVEILDSANYNGQDYITKFALSVELDESFVGNLTTYQAPLDFSVIADFIGGESPFLTFYITNYSLHPDADDEDHIYTVQSVSDYKLEAEPYRDTVVEDDPVWEGQPVLLGAPGWETVLRFQPAAKDDEPHLTAEQGLTKRVIGPGGGEITSPVKVWAGDEVPIALGGFENLQPNSLSAFRITDNGYDTEQMSPLEFFQGVYTVDGADDPESSQARWLENKTFSIHFTFENGDQRTLSDLSLTNYHENSMEGWQHIHDAVEIWQDRSRVTEVIFDYGEVLPGFRPEAGMAPQIKFKIYKNADDFEGGSPAQTYTNTALMSYTYQGTEFNADADLELLFDDPEVVLNNDYNKHAKNLTTGNTGFTGHKAGDVIEFTLYIINNSSHTLQTVFIHDFYSQYLTPYNQNGELDLDLRISGNRSYPVESVEVKQRGNDDYLVIELDTSSYPLPPEGYLTINYQMRVLPMEDDEELIANYFHAYGIPVEPGARPVWMDSGLYGGQGTSGDGKPVVSVFKEAVAANGNPNNLTNGDQVDLTFTLMREDLASSNPLTLVSFYDVVGNTTMSGQRVGYYTVPQTEDEVTITYYKADGTQEPLAFSISDHPDLDPSYRIRFDLDTPLDLQHGDKVVVTYSAQVQNLTTTNLTNLNHNSYAGFAQTFAGAGNANSQYDVKNGSGGTKTPGTNGPDLNPATKGTASASVTLKGRVKPEGIRTDITKTADTMDLRSWDMRKHTITVHNYTYDDLTFTHLVDFLPEYEELSSDYVSHDGYDYNAIYITYPSQTGAPTTGIIPVDQVKVEEVETLDPMGNLTTQKKLIFHDFTDAEPQNAAVSNSNLVIPAQTGSNISTAAGAAYRITFYTKLNISQKQMAQLIYDAETASATSTQYTAAYFEMEPALGAVANNNGTPHSGYVADRQDWDSSQTTQARLQTSYTATWTVPRIHPQVALAPHSISYNSSSETYSYNPYSMETSSPIKSGDTMGWYLQVGNSGMNSSLLTSVAKGSQVMVLLPQGMTLHGWGYTDLAAAPSSGMVFTGTVTRDDGRQALMFELQNDIYGYQYHSYSYKHYFRTRTNSEFAGSVTAEVYFIPNQDPDLNYQFMFPSDYSASLRSRDGQIGYGRSIEHPELAPLPGEKGIQLVYNTGHVKLMDQFGSNARLTVSNGSSSVHSDMTSDRLLSLAAPDQPFDYTMTVTNSSTGSMNYENLVLINALPITGDRLLFSGTGRGSTIGAQFVQQTPPVSVSILNETNESQPLNAGDYSITYSTLEHAAYNKSDWALENGTPQGNWQDTLPSGGAAAVRIQLNTPLLPKHTLQAVFQGALDEQSLETDGLAAYDSFGYAFQVARGSSLISAMSEPFPVGVTFPSLGSQVEITKVIHEDDLLDGNKEFDFWLTGTDDQGYSQYSEKVTVILTDRNPLGRWSGTKKLERLPAGLTYSVEELGLDPKYAEPQIVQTGPVTNQHGSQLWGFTVTNTLDTIDLKVKKELSPLEGISPDSSYRFLVTGTLAQATEYQEEISVPVRRQSNGSYSGEVLLTDLPGWLDYTVTEVLNDADLDKYKQPEVTGPSPLEDGFGNVVGQLFQVRNEYRTVDLSLEKTLVLPDGYSPPDSLTYQFTVTGVADGQEIYKNDAVTITLASDGQGYSGSALLTGLPAWLEYSVTENDPGDRYRQPEITQATQNGSDGRPTAHTFQITNRLNTVDVTINKEFIPPAGYTPTAGEQSFTFTLTGMDDTAQAYQKQFDLPVTAGENGSYTGTYTLADLPGWLDYSLAEQLPAGSHFREPHITRGADTSAAGDVVSYRFDVVNTMETITVDIEKTLIVPTGYLPQDASFSFELVGSLNDISVYRNSDITIATGTGNGSTLNGSITLENLPGWLDYSLVETNLGAEYQQPVIIKQNGVGNNGYRFLVHNRLNTILLDLVKSAPIPDGYTPEGNTRSYQFVVIGSQGGSELYRRELQVDATLSGNAFTGTAAITDLPGWLDYSVTEADPGQQYGSPVINLEPVTNETSRLTGYLCQVTNPAYTANLTITKELELPDGYTPGDTSPTYLFDVTGKEQGREAYRQTGVALQATAGENGAYTGSVTIADLPAWLDYTVTEQDPGVQYDQPVIIPSVVKNDSGTISEFVFAATNRYKTVSLELVKNWELPEGYAPQENSKDFRFLVTGKENGVEQYRSGPITITTTPQGGSLYTGSILLENLPAWLDYSVTELDLEQEFEAPEITRTSSTENGVVTGHTFTITNRLKTVYLDLNKTLELPESYIPQEDSIPFTFLVTGSQGGGEVYRRQAVVIVTPGAAGAYTGSLRLENLPAGLEYTVAEVDLAPGYQPPVITSQAITDAGVLLGYRFDALNRFGTISLEINKQLVLPEGHTATGEELTYTFTVTGVSGQEQVYRNEQVAVTLDPVSLTGSVTLQNLPGWLDYTVEEQNPGERFLPPDIAKTTLTNGNGEAIGYTFHAVNRYKTVFVEIEKLLELPAGYTPDADALSYRFSVVGRENGVEAYRNDDVTLELSPGGYTGKVLLENLPAWLDYSITEQELDSRYSTPTTTHTTAEADGAVVGHHYQVTNRFRTLTVGIDKELEFNSETPPHTYFEFLLTAFDGEVPVQIRPVSLSVSQQPDGSWAGSSLVENLPAWYTYTLEELLEDDGYLEPEIHASQTAGLLTFRVKNRYEQETLPAVTSLRINKDLFTNGQTPPGTTFRFTVTGTADGSIAYENQDVAVTVAQTAASHYTGSVLLEGLPSGLVYTVTEHVLTDTRYEPPQVEQLSAPGEDGNGIWEFRVVNTLRRPGGTSKPTPTDPEPDPEPGTDPGQGQKPKPPSLTIRRPNREITEEEVVITQQLIEIIDQAVPLAQFFNPFTGPVAVLPHGVGALALIGAGLLLPFTGKRRRKAR